MTSKTIIIREDVYRMLLSIKGTRESFSDFFERMVISRRNLDKLKELRGFVEVKDKDAVLKELSEISIDERISILSEIFAIVNKKNTDVT